MDIRRHVTVDRLGKIAFAGVMAFVMVCGIAQFLRADLDWIRAPLSFYLIGPGGWWVKAAYLALSASLVAIGTGYGKTPVTVDRALLPSVLFWVSAVSLAITALSDTATHRGEVSLHSKIHAAAAAVTFTCVTTAMLLQSWRLRIDPVRSDRFRPMLLLAATAFIALWLYALTHLLPKGLMQKIVIGLIIAWLGLAALMLHEKHR
jgi:hypothetical protein